VRVRAAVRGHVWSLIRATPAGFPWLAIAGKLLAGWLVIDLDAMLITACSDKEGAAPTVKMGDGFHPLGTWLANTADVAPVASDRHDRVTCTDLELWDGPGARMTGFG
jgi:hypothetical protein